MNAGFFEVRIAPHGRVIRVAADTPVLEAALAAGLNLPHSCKSGHCSSCRARLIRGQVHYPRGRPLGLTESEHTSGYVLLCQARALSDLAVQARQIANVADVEIKTLPCRIERMTALAPDVMQVFLRLPAVESLSFQAGQYLDVLLEGGGRRSFSIACPPYDSALLELHARRVPGGRFTDALFSTLKPGSLLKIEGPLGQFVYRPGPRPVLMIAGGTGFAPIKAMLRQMLEREPPRPVSLYWGARQAPDVYEEALLLGWAARYPQLKFFAVLSEAASAGAAHRRVGWVHETVLADHPDLSGLDVYVAGPPGLIEAVRSRFPACGLDPQHLHFDSFDYATD